MYIQILETLIFKGSYHIKRSHGITQLPAWIMKNSYIDFVDIFKNMFIREYKDTFSKDQHNKDDENENENDSSENDNENTSEDDNDKTIIYQKKSLKST